MRISLVLVTLTLLAACQPPASDDPSSRARGTDRSGPSAPLDSPETEQAAWADSREGDRIIYGNPGEPPLFALACREAEDGPRIVYERLAPADPGARAILALIGNSHVTRLFIDAVETGETWRWRGEIAADDPQLDVLTGSRQVEATVPGAGSVILNPSARPGAFILACRNRGEEPSAPVRPEDRP